MEKMLMNNCIGIMGKLFGHKYKKPKYIPNMKVHHIEKYYDELHKTKERCTRCGEGE
jgi:hypothetical protein